MIDGQIMGRSIAWNFAKTGITMLIEQVMGRLAFEMNASRANKSNGTRGKRFCHLLKRKKMKCVR
jgi:hypothetical protein